MLECVGHDPGVLGSDLVNICIIKTKIGVANISLQCRTQYWLHSTGSVNYHLWWCHVKCFVCFSSDSFLNERRNGKYYWQLWELTRREENIIANISLIIARLHQQVLTRFCNLPISTLCAFWKFQYFNKGKWGLFMQCRVELHSKYSIPDEIREKIV